MTYKEYLKLVDQTYNHFNWRYGQTVMNVLFSVWKEKYTEIFGSEHDCYYNEDVVSATLNKLQKEWIHE